jgi:hypothetical protein
MHFEINCGFAFSLVRKRFPYLVERPSQRQMSRRLKAIIQFFLYSSLRVPLSQNTYHNPAITHNYVQKVIQIYKRTLKLLKL